MPLVIVEMRTGFIRILFAFSNQSLMPTFCFLFIVDMNDNVVEEPCARRSECVKVARLLVLQIVDANAHVLGLATEQVGRGT